jgi:CheY-like chemotaxis protein
MTRRFEGAGLGLALTHRYLELNRANLTVRSEKGIGSTFTIHFAQAAVATYGKASSNGAGSPLRVPAHQPPIEPMVMLVEDDPDNRIMMRAMMKNRYRILAAASPAEARAQIENYPATIDLILMDLGLRSPEDGLALTRSLRTLERFRTTPIVAVTGHAMSVNRAQALAAGCDDYIVKPFDRALLFATIERLIHPQR